MISKILILFIFIIFSAIAAEGCEVYLPSHLFVLSENATFNKSMQHTSCSQEAVGEINDTLNSVEGKITSLQLSEILKSKNHIVEIHPEFIQVQHLKHSIREQLILPAGIQLRSSEAINFPNYFSLATGDRVEINCVGCLFGSQQFLNVNVIGLDGSNKSVTVKADFRKMVRAYRVLGFLPAFTEISSASLKEVFVESIPHIDFMTNLATLKFYKLNKPIRSGDILRQSDLNALNLVKAGLKTEVIIENELIKLKTHGISRSNGTLGEFVEVFHPQKNKKYQGKVIDINKVLVEL